MKSEGVGRSLAVLETEMMVKKKKEKSQCRRKAQDVIVRLGGRGRVVLCWTQSKKACRSLRERNQTQRKG